MSAMTDDIDADEVIQVDWLGRAPLECFRIDVSVPTDAVKVRDTEIANLREAIQGLLRTCRALFDYPEKVVERIYEAAESVGAEVVEV